MPSILQLSDAHLSPRNTLFRGNLARIRDAVAATPLDLVVATGDLSLDGADRDEDLALAAQLHRDFPAPLLALPGNHDVGSHAHTMPRQPIDTARLDRFRTHLGAGHGIVDLPGWRVVGLNSEIMGTGLAEEARHGDTVAQRHPPPDLRRPWLAPAGDAAPVSPNCRQSVRSSVTLPWLWGSFRPVRGPRPEPGHAPSPRRASPNRRLP